MWPYNDEIAQKFSFAGTVSSIILSVLAIIVTLVGEGNIDSIRQRIDSSTSDLKTVTDQIKENNGNLQETMDEIIKMKTTVTEKIDNIENLFVSTPDNIKNADTSEKSIDLLNVFYEMIERSTGEKILIALYCAKYAKNKGYKIAAFTRYIFEKLELRGYATYSGTAAPFLKLYRLTGFKNTMEKELLERGLMDRIRKAAASFECDREEG